MPTASEGQQKKQYQQVPYRLVVISVYILASLVNQIPANTFAAMTSKVEKQFSIPTILVTLNFLFFPISHCIFAMPVNWALTKRGIRFSYIIASIAMIAGVWLRTTLTESDPYVCLLGSLLCGGSGLILLSSGSKVTLNWFKKEHLTPVTFICVLVNFLSLSIGLSLPGMFINPDSTQAEIIDFLRMQAIVVSVPFVLLAIFIRDKPQHPPSRHAQVEHDSKDNRYRDVLKLLFKNTNYLKMLVVMCLTFGSVVTFLSIIDRCLKGLGYPNPSAVISKVVIAMTIAGICGNIVFSALVKRTKQYRIIATIINIGFLTGYVLLCLGFAYQLEATWQLIMLPIIFGFNYYSIPSYFVVYGAQIAFPVDQASVAGYLFAISQTFGFVLSLILLPFVNETKDNAVLLFIIIGGFALIGSLLTPFIKEDLRKDKFEHGLLGDDLRKVLKQEVQEVEIPIEDLSVSSEEEEKRLKSLQNSPTNKKKSIN